jgi:hypothetical protein
MIPPTEFTRLVSALVARFVAQVGRPPVAATALAQFAANLERLVAAHGLPPPLEPGDPGTPGGMSEEACAPLVAQVLAGIEPSTAATLADAARQLVKASFYPEFTVCRESYREVARDGVCRRQDLARVRTRISGTHCVDCPHWVALSAEAHAALLAAAWQGDAAEFAANRGVFLPEDFRAFRRWRLAAARQRP